MRYVPRWLPCREALTFAIEVSSGSGPIDVATLTFELCAAAFDGKVRCQDDWGEVSVEELVFLFETPDRWRRQWGTSPHAIELRADDIRHVFGATEGAKTMSGSEHQHSRGTVELESAGIGWPADKRVFSAPLPCRQQQSASQRGAGMRVPEWLSPAEALEYAIGFEIDSLGYGGGPEHFRRLISWLCALVLEGRVRVRQDWRELSLAEVRSVAGTPAECRRRWRKWPEGIPEGWEFRSQDIQRVCESTIQSSEATTADLESVSSCAQKSTDPATGVLRQKPAAEAHNRWIASAREIRRTHPAWSVSRIADAVCRRETSLPDKSPHEKPRSRETIRRILQERRTEW
jgi:hypothetical protein